MLSGRSSPLSTHSTVSSRKGSKSIPPKLPELDVEPALPVSNDGVLPDTPMQSMGHVRMLQVLRRSTPQIRTSWPPSASGSRVPLTSGAGWVAPVQVLAPLPPSAPKEPSAKCRPRRQSNGRTRAQLDCAVAERSAAPVAAEIKPPAHIVPPVPTEEPAMLRPDSGKRRSQSEAPTSQATPQVKQQAISALQKFFFEELQKGHDASGAAAQALLRLNELASAEPAPSEQVRMPMRSPPRPPTPLVGRPSGRRAIRVSNY